MEQIELRIVFNADRKLKDISMYADNLDTIKDDLRIFTAFLMFGDQYSHFVRSVNLFNLNEIQYTLDDEKYEPKIVKITEGQISKVLIGSMSTFEVVLCVVRSEFKQVLLDHEKIVYEDMPKIINYLRENNLVEDILKHAKKINTGYEKLNEMVMSDLEQSLKGNIDE